MKNAPGLLLLLIAAFFAFQAQAQTCVRIASDSVIAGNNETEHNNWIYNNQGKLIKVEFTDSGQTNVGAYDSLVYNNNGLLSEVIWVSSFSGPTDERDTFEYDSNDRIIRFTEEVGSDWSASYDISYNASGLPVSVVADPLSIGDSISEVQNFENITWSGGNLEYVDLIFINIDSNTTDTIELAATFDDKNNLERLKYIRDAAGFIFNFNQNNMMQVTLVNNEDVGPAGTVVFERKFTYYSNNEVETEEILPAPLAGEDTMTTLYTYTSVTASMGGLAAEYCSTDAAVTLNGSPSGGTFNGNGVSGSSFDPAVAGVGTHTITYSYTDDYGCTTETQQQVTVNNCTGIGETAASAGVEIYPNPAQSTLTVILSEVKRSEESVLALYNLLGEKVYEETNTTEKTEIDLTGYAPGVYFLKVNTGKDQLVKKVVKE